MKSCVYFLLFIFESQYVFLKPSKSFTYEQVLGDNMRVVKTSISWIFLWISFHEKNCFLLMSFSESENSRQAQSRLGDNVKTFKIESCSRITDESNRTNFGISLRDVTRHNFTFSKWFQKEHWKHSKRD